MAPGLDDVLQEVLGQLPPGLLPEIAGSVERLVAGPVASLLDSAQAFLESPEVPLPAIPWRELRSAAGAFGLSSAEAVRDALLATMAPADGPAAPATPAPQEPPGPRAVDQGEDLPPALEGGPESRLPAPGPPEGIEAVIDSLTPALLAYTIGHSVRGDRWSGSGESRTRRRAGGRPGRKEVEG
jgi:hypothetical protein